MYKETLLCFSILVIVLVSAGCSDSGRKSCETSADCGTGQVCDPASKKCRDVLTCADLDCGANRLCQAAAAGQDAECLDECEPGFVWNPGAESCDPATSCDQLDCESQNRECVQEGTGVRCGDCLPGFQEDANGDCVEFDTCEPYVAGSILQECDDAGRECVEDVAGQAECGDCKNAAQILDPDTGICRDRKTCADIACDPGLFCLEPPDGDAYCSDQCQDAEGNPGIVNQDGVCILCPKCDDAAAGEDGAYLDELSGEGRCVCKTLDGYYWQEGEPTGVTPCDRDQDGWVRHSAKAALESPSNAIQVNARCHVRSIDNFVLHNESGQELTIPAGGASAYESDRNDDQDLLDQAVAAGDLRLPPYPEGRALKAEELNSLTKACVSVDADYNHNAVEDINECEGTGLGAGYEVYEPFVDFSYFMELHRGRFEPVSGDAGNYYIYEKSRTRTEDGWRVPLVYPPDLNNPEKQVYWRDCTLKRDSVYGGSGANKQGLDFGQFAEDTSDPANPWYGMNYHSLFKCLHISSTPPGPSRPLNEMTRQEVLEAGYAVNDCTAASTSVAPGPEGWDAKNPHDPVIACTTVDAADVPIGGVMWAVSGYRDYSDPAGYVRGCVNECAETSQTCAACPQTRESCQGFDPDQPWRTQCVGDPNNFGSLFCGCTLNYGGADCEHRCEGGDPRQIDYATGFTRLFLGTNFSDPPRSGYWMCAGPVQTAYQDTSSPQMEGGGYKLFGRIPNELRTTGQVLCADPPNCTSGGYQIR